VEYVEEPPDDIKGMEAEGRSAWVFAKGNIASQCSTAEGKREG
jgi:hypothetical protein